MERTPDLYAYLTGTYTPIKHLQLTVTGIFTGPMLVYHHVSDDNDAKHGGEGNWRKAEYIKPGTTPLQYSQE